MTMPGYRSRKVRRILQLEGRAAHLLARYEGMLANLVPSRHKAEQLRHRVRALKVTLTAAQVLELRSARRGV
jgi:hypothetical protein